MAIFKKVGDFISDSVNGDSEGVTKQLSEKELMQILTPRRIELLRAIRKYEPKTLSELARMVKRKVEAVDRDIRLLKKYELVLLERNSLGVAPRAAKKFFVLPLADPKPMIGFVHPK